MQSITRTRILWISSVASLALATATSACSSKSSGGSSNPEDGGNEPDSESSSSSGGSSSSSGGGSSSSSGGSSSSSGGVTDGGSDAAALSDASPSEGGSSSGADASCTALAVYNFKSWCSVGISGATPVTSAMQSACLAPGSIPLVAEPASSVFELGPDPWVHISGTGGTTTGISGTIVGDGGVGSTSSTAVVLGSTAGCVLVCCPFTNGTGCTSAEDGYTAFLANCP
jgi:hypothetical protein